MSNRTRANWTLAWRNSRHANRLVRATNWAGTWEQALYLAGEMREAMVKAGRSDAQVYYVTTLEYERDQAREIAAGTLRPEYAEDHGNMLMETGRRVRMVTNGAIPASVLSRVLPLDVAEARYTVGCSGMPHVPCTCTGEQFEESHLSDCPHGCKVYACRLHGHRRTVHLDAYGCPRARCGCPDDRSCSTCAR